MRNVGIGTNGVGVEDQGEAGLGRVLVATRDFDVGDIILEEAPLVVFANSWLGLLQQYYTKMNKDDKMKLMDMQHLSCKEEAHFEEFIAPLSARLDLLLQQTPIQQFLQIFQAPENFIFQLASLVSINSHMYTEEDDSNDTTLQSALFYLASKASHSCDPNACYSSKLKSKHLVYYAIRPIVCGEMITISYLPPNPFSTEQRRAFLKQAKDFYCLCRKCNSPDYLSAMKCVDHHNCPGLMIPTYLSTGSPGPTSSSSWCCEDCYTTITPNLTTVLTFQQRLNRIIEAAEERGGSTAEDCQALEVLLKDMTADKCSLPSGHHIVLEARLKLFNFYSELAMLADQFDPNLASRLHTDASRIGFPLIRYWECAEEMCNAGEGCKATHRIVVDAVPVVLAVSLDAMKAQQVLPDWVQRYVPYLQRCYGVMDTDVLLVKKTCRNAAVN